MKHIRKEQTMAGYIAMRLEEGKVNYNTIFNTERLKKFKDDVDSILAIDGYKVNADGTVTKKEAEK